MAADGAGAAETNIQQVARGEGETSASRKEKMGRTLGERAQGQQENNANRKS